MPTNDAAAGILSDAPAQSDGDREFALLSNT